MLKFQNGVIVDMTPEEEEAVKQAVKEYGERELKRPLEQHEVIDLMLKKLVNTVSIDDATSLRMKEWYPTFESLGDGKDYPKGFKFTYRGELWKTRQEPTRVQQIYPPSIDTASLYERINETNAGTIDDPVPYDEKMEVFAGYYYSYNEKIYKCIRDSGIPLFATPDKLLGNYFELIE